VAKGQKYGPALPRAFQLIALLEARFSAVGLLKSVRRCFILSYSFTFFPFGLHFEHSKQKKNPFG
jgi:hypothetical protein